MTKLIHVMTKYGEWIRWALVMLAVLAQLWLLNHFVTLERYERDMQQNNVAHSDIQKAINGIAQTLAVMASNEAKLIDHEARIRSVENRQIDVMARVGAIERLLDNKP